MGTDAQPYLGFSLVVEEADGNMEKLLTTTVHTGDQLYGPDSLTEMSTSLQPASQQPGETLGDHREGTKRKSAYLNPVTYSDNLQDPSCESQSILSDESKEPESGSTGVLLKQMSEDSGIAYRNPVQPPTMLFPGDLW